MALDTERAVMAKGSPSALDRIFGFGKALIGNLHLPPLPGTPRYEGDTVAQIAERALADLAAYQDGGMDGVVIENHGDIPFVKPGQIGPEIIAAMAAIAERLSSEARIPYGINLLANGAIGALAIAKATGADFVRVNQWTNSYVSNEGVLDGEAGAALRFRRSIGAENVAVFADVHVKHGAHAITQDRGIDELARDVDFFDADVAIVTGNRTGDAIPVEEIAAIREGTRLPVIGGSGMTAANAPELLRLLDGAIVGSSLKLADHWANPVDPERVAAFIKVARKLDPAAGIGMERSSAGASNDK